MRTKVGIVSFAHMHAYEYANVLAKLGDISEFVGVTDEDASRGLAAAKEHGAEFFKDSRHLLEEVDAAIVCSETREHSRYTIEALDFNVHVLCEKPIATTLEDAREMIDAANRNGMQLRIALPVRFLSAVRQAKEAIDSGTIGRVVAVNGTNHGKIPGGWFMDPDAAGGGAVMDHTVHLVDTLRWMLGTEVESVYAEIGDFFNHDGLDDGAILTLELASGAFVSIDPSWSRGDGFPTWGDVTLQVTGTDGVIELDAFSQSVTVFEHDAPGTEWLSPGDDMNQRMLEHFIRGVQGDSPEGASAEDGLRALEVVHAAYRSARDHEPQQIGSANT